MKVVWVEPIVCHVHMTLHTVPIICSNHVFQGYSSPILRPALVSTEPITLLSLPVLTPCFFFLFSLFGGEKKSKNFSLKSWVPSATVTQDTGAKIFESNFISRI
jgi:hypothetical protein